MKASKKLLYLLSLTLFCAACGGGGGNDDSSDQGPPPPDTSMDWNDDNWDEKDWE